MIGDVSKANKQFREILGKTEADNLLKRAEKSEKSNYNAKYVVNTVVGPKIKGKYDDLLSEENIGKILDKNGIIDRLSTRPHTNRNSNFVKLVKRYTVDKKELKDFLCGQDATEKELAKQNITRFYRYLNLEKNNPENAETLNSESDLNLKIFLKRKKNENVFDKMYSLRKVNRLKVIVVALLICLIDYRVKHPAGSSSASASTPQVHTPPLNKVKTPTKAPNSSVLKSFSPAKISGDTLTIDGVNDLTNISNWDEKYCKKIKKLIVGNFDNLELPDQIKTHTHTFDFILPNLSELTVLGTVKKIGENVFSDCKNLTKLTLCEGIGEIGFRSFGSCITLETVIIPNTVQTVGEYAFYGCSEVTTLTIGSGVTEIGKLAFGDFCALGELTVPRNVNKIGDKAFLSCDSLNRLTIEYGVQEIGDSAFSHPNYRFVIIPLEELVIPQSVNKIGDMSFAGFSKLKKLTIENDKIEIGLQAFSDCHALQEQGAVINASGEVADKVRETIGRRY